MSIKGATGVIDLPPIIPVIEPITHALKIRCLVFVLFLSPCKKKRKKQKKTEKNRKKQKKTEKNRTRLGSARLGSARLGSARRRIYIQPRLTPHRAYYPTMQARI
jgi:hypothetical protein